VRWEGRRSRSIGYLKCSAFEAVGSFSFKELTMFDFSGLFTQILGSVQELFSTSLLAFLQQLLGSIFPQG
jgi:hypothetical protein